MPEPTQTGLQAINKDIVDSMLSKLEAKKKEPDNAVVLLEFSELYKMLSEKEEAFVKDMLAIEPEGEGEFYGIEPPPANLVKIEGQSYIWKGEKKDIATQYLPKNVFNAYKKK